VKNVTQQAIVRTQIEKSVTVKINTKISGDSAKVLLELKRRGIVTSNTDAIIQGLFALQEKVIQRDLALARLQNTREE